MAHAEGIEFNITSSQGEGFATSGDVGVTGQPIWTVHFDDDSEWDGYLGHGKLHDFEIECGLADLAGLLSERFGFDVGID